MINRTFSEFWEHYDALPTEIRELADKNNKLLENDLTHPSLHFKKVGNKKQFWSVRVGISLRALAIEPEKGVIAWFWIGTHAEYDRIIK